MVLILAIDASTPVTTVAVGRGNSRDREVITEVSTTGRGASETLLPAVRAALDLANESLDSVELMVTGVGPGTFTGIRIAAATARALAAGSGISLARNSTLDALAAPALSCSPDVLAVLDARRGQVFARRFSASGPTTGIYCVRPQELEAEGEPVIVGDGAVRYREDLTRLGPVPPVGSPLHRVTAAGHIVSADLTPVGQEEIVPIYVREPDAEVRRDLNPWSHP